MRKNPRGEGEIGGVIIFALIVWGVGSLFGWWGPSKEDKLRTALQEANTQIGYCNDQINNAREQAWQDYDTMGATLNDLENCSTVSDPTK